MKKQVEEKPFAERPYEEYKLRIEKAKKLMAERKIDALLIFSPINVRYYTGFVKTSTCTGAWKRRSALLPIDGDPVLIGNFMSYAPITTWVKDVRERIVPPSDSKPYAELYVETIKDLKLSNKVLGIDLDYWYPGVWALDVSPLDVEFVKKSLPDAKFVDAYELVREQRMVKTDYEIGIFRECCHKTAESFKKAFKAAREGVTETEINQILWQSFISQGGLVSDAVLVGRMTIDAHDRVISIPLERKLERGDQITYNGGACYRGYHSDVSRIISVGEPSKKQRDLYDAVSKAGDVAIQHLKPGKRASDVYNAAMKTLKEINPKIKPSWIAVGHGIGLDSHEPPYLSPDINVVFKPGMVIAMEVIVSDPEAGLFGGTIEDDFLITEDGCENFTGPPNRLPREVMIV